MNADNQIVKKLSCPKKIFCKFALQILALFQNFRGVAQLASVLAWGARGRKFESSRPDKKTTYSDNIKQVVFLFACNPVYQTLSFR